MSGDTYLMKLKKRERLMRDELQIQYNVKSLQLEKALAIGPVQTDPISLVVSESPKRNSVARKLFDEGTVITICK